MNYTDINERNLYVIIIFVNNFTLNVYFRMKTGSDP